MSNYPNMIFLLEKATTCVIFEGKCCLVLNTCCFINHVCKRFLKNCSLCQNHLLNTIWQHWSRTLSVLCIVVILIDDG